MNDDWFPRLEVEENGTRKSVLVDELSSDDLERILLGKTHRELVDILMKTYDHLLMVLAESGFYDEEDV